MWLLLLLLLSVIREVGFVVVHVVCGRGVKDGTEREAKEGD